MSNYIIAVEIIIRGIKVALIDKETKLLVPGTTVVERDVNAKGSADYLFGNWGDAINECIRLHSASVTHMAIAMPGQREFNDGISYIQGQNKFDSIYGMNIKESIGERTGIPANNIRIQNSSPAFMCREVILGATEGYTDCLGFTLESGFGTVRYISGEIIDADLWKAPFRDGIVEDYLGIRWFAERYAEFTGHTIIDLHELSALAQTDDGICQLVFNEYSENFTKFLIQEVNTNKTDLILIGGHDDVWDLYIPHVKDRLSDENINIPIRKAVQGDLATLVGAANQWQ